MADRATEILTWYDAHARVLPWRVPPGKARKANPYHVWLSEIMLQQTTVVTVIPYFEAFTARWRSAEDLAAAPLDEVLTAWAGLGYYARARNLHACAQVVAKDQKGRFPDTEEGLLALPGIGPYTAAAIAAIAFGRRAVVVDGNVERVMARLHGIETPLRQAKPELRAKAAQLTPSKRPGDYAQAVMDLGATVCTPRNPSCSVCPWVRSCIAHRAGRATDFPVRGEKSAKPMRKGLVFWAERADRAVLIRQRAGKGLLAKMMEFPSAGWNTRKDPVPDVMRDAPCKGTWEKVPGTVRHTFTHFHLELTVYRARVSAGAAREAKGVWVQPENFSAHALPTVMRKVAAHVLEGDGPLFSHK